MDFIFITKIFVVVDDFFIFKVTSLNDEISYNSVFRRDSHCNT